ncbi:hypothetical protein [Rhodoblastus sp.]|uniref:hypothetical protein n=1 Tax=Rhodoblastus sp. TaxID=1962975 RepID=UPI0035B4F8E3
MRIGSSKDLSNQTLTSLGKISAASDWRGAGEDIDAQLFRLKALHKLMRAAEDCDADALVDVDYSEEILPRAEHPGAAPLKRVCATATAVKLKSA